MQTKKREAFEIDICKIGRYICGRTFCSSGTHHCHQYLAKFGGRNPRDGKDEIDRGEDEGDERLEVKGLSLSKPAACPLNAHMIVQSRNCTTITSTLTHSHMNLQPWNNSDQCISSVSLILSSAFNSICICAGAEWKTAFSTSSGHHQYQVRTRLSCALSIIQCFSNDVLRDMLRKFVIMYIDNILIYSASRVMLC